MNDKELLEKIRQHYNGIDINRLKKRLRCASEEAASRLNIMPIIGHANTFENWQRLKNTPEYKKELAAIYRQISGYEKYIATDMQTISSNFLGIDPNCNDIFISITFLNKWCKEYYDLIEGTEYDLQPMQQAATLPDSLNNEKVKRAFEIAKERGYISEGGNPYKWNMPPVLLAYFIGRLLGDKTTRDPISGKSEWVQVSMFPKKEIEAYFDCKNVGQLRNNKKQSGYAPRGAGLIDDIINNL